MNNNSEHGRQEKGDLNGECYRTACSNKGADFYNHSTRKYYCASCASIINEVNRKDAYELYGHELCIKESAAPPPTVIQPLGLQWVKASEFNFEDDGIRYFYKVPDNGAMGICRKNENDIEYIVYGDWEKYESTLQMYILDESAPPPQPLGIDVIKKRISEFQKIYHANEAGRLTLALKAIEELIPPSYFAASPKYSNAEEAIGERTFSLKEALDIANDFYGRGMVREYENKQQYFKDKFGIEI